jgi:hypothetical protein
MPEQKPAQQQAVPVPKPPAPKPQRLISPPSPLKGRPAPATILPDPAMQSHYEELGTIELPIKVSETGLCMHVRMHAIHACTGNSA